MDNFCKPKLKKRKHDGDDTSIDSAFDNARNSSAAMASSDTTYDDDTTNDVESSAGPQKSKSAIKTKRWREKKQREAEEMHEELSHLRILCQTLKNDNQDLRERLRLLGGADPSTGFATAGNDVLQHSTKPKAKEGGDGHHNRLTKGAGSNPASASAGSELHGIATPR
jgi:hypothetical protein